MIQWGYKLYGLLRNLMILVLVTSYLHQRNTRGFDWLQKKQVLKYLNTQASFNEDIVTGFRRGTIRGTITLESTVKITPVGLSNFMNPNDRRFSK